MKGIEKITIHTDGGAIPGRDAVIGYVIENEEGETVARGSRNIGRRTSNEAEFIACIEAFKDAMRAFGIMNGDIMTPGIPVRITFVSDSMLLVNQLSGNWRVKHPRMRALVTEFGRLWRSSGFFVDFRHVPRDRNKEADALARAAYHELPEPWNFA